MLAEIYPRVIPAIRFNVDFPHSPFPCKTECTMCVLCVLHGVAECEKCTVNPIADLLTILEKTS